MKLDNFEMLFSSETDPRMREVLGDALLVAECVKGADGRALVVGGFVRDLVMSMEGYGTPSKDVDIEVYGLTVDQLKDAMSQLPKHSDIVGQQFGVIKYGELDVSLPRSDSKSGEGHRGFAVAMDPNMSVEDAARRRDLTINTLSMDPFSGQVFDYHGGVADIQNKLLRATDDKLFGDDPLRVLRVMQFAGRFGFDVEPSTVELCQSIDLSSLSIERVGEEWKKLLCKSPKPSVGLEVGLRLGVIKKLHPALQALIGCEQETDWHPEGDVWTHTLMAVDEAAAIAEREGLRGDDKWVLVLAALCHDIGKPDTTIFDEHKQRITSSGHDVVGEKIAKEFLRSIYVPLEISRRVTPLVRHHMYPPNSSNAGLPSIRRLANNLQPATISELVLLSEADRRGRGTKWDGAPESKRLLNIAKDLKIANNRLEPLLLGRHLIDEGVQPGAGMGKLLKDLYEAQLEGEFETLEQGLEYYTSSV
jgi:tRNA nucleotidyltransferase (CCA-adding enzyme)